MRPSPRSRAQMAGHLSIAAMELMRACAVRAVAPASHLSAAPQRPASTRRETNVAAVSWAIAAWGARFSPFSNCLVQAIAADHWLRRRGYDPRLQIGVARTDASGLAAHAWLTLDGETVVGGSTAGFTPMLDSRPS